MQRPNQPQHSHLYWEYQNQRAVREGNWKAYRGAKSKWELYDLSVDIQEKHNVATKHLDVLQRLIAIAKEAHQPVKPGEVYDQKLAKKDRH